MNKIVKIWFEGDLLIGETSQGELKEQSLLWYPRLLNANDSERNKYRFGITGIHWPELDEDVSFESFDYEDAVPTPLQHFFLTHSEINIAGFAKSIGINASLLRNYINGFKKPSARREREIIKGLHTLGYELLNLKFSR